MVSSPTTEIEQWALLATLTFLGIMFIGTFVALIVMIALHPRNRGEWAEFSKALCIVLILSRSFLTRFTGISFSPIQDLAFWLLLLPLITFFTLNIIFTWGQIALDMVGRRDRMYIGGGFLLVVLMILLLIWIL